MSSFVTRGVLWAIAKALRRTSNRLLLRILVRRWSGQLWNDAWGLRAASRAASSLHDAALMACRLVLCRTARTGSRAFGTKLDPATCLGPRPDLAHSPLTFDAFHYNFDQGRATGQPVCGVVDGFLTEAECSKLIDLATARGYESTEETIQHSGRKGRKNDASVINISGRCVIDSQKFADKLWARLARSAAMQPVKALLKQSNPGWSPVGLNSVFRFLRYGPGDYFRPHRDSHFVPEVNDVRLPTCCSPAC